MITRNRQSANLTIMPSLAQCLRIRRSTHASLRRSTRVYFQQHTTSLRRFVSELGDERRPSGVINRLSEHSCRQALDIQVLDNDQSKYNNQSPGNFVREIRSLVAHVGVCAASLARLSFGYYRRAYGERPCAAPAAERLELLCNIWDFRSRFRPRAQQRLEALHQDQPSRSKAAKVSVHILY